MFTSSLTFNYCSTILNFTTNLYQSALRTHINRDVFAKPVFSILREGSDYQVICKEKKIFWIIIVRFQILGVTMEQWNNCSASKKVILEGARKHYWNKLFVPIYIQLGFVDQLYVQESSKLKTDTGALLDEFIELKSTFYFQCLNLGLVSAKKHNMPDATIVIDLHKTKEELWADISKNTKEKIKKAEKGIVSHKLHIAQADKISDYELFYELYTQTAWSKGFGAVTEQMREDLVQDSVKWGYWKLFMVKSDEWELISWAFCIQNEDNLIYLYGANDRRFGNIGLSQFLHRTIIQYAKEADLHRYDFLGASWFGKENDWLAQVTQFKMGFGWMKIEYGWNWDFVLNKWLYKLYR